MRRFLEPALLIILTVAAYAGAVGGEWHLDDYTYIIEDPATGDLGARLRDALVDSRGVGRLSFTLNHAIGGGDPRGYHLVNIAIHLVNAFLVFLFARAVFAAPRIAPSLPSAERTGLAWCVALLFALHPLQTEAVTYVVQRWTALAGTFYLGASLAMIAFLRATTRPGAPREGSRDRVSPALLYAVAVLLALFGMKTKEFCVTLPIAFLAYRFLLFPRTPGRPVWRDALPIAPALLLLAVIPVTNALRPHYNVTGGLRLADLFRETRAISPGDYLLTQFGVVLHYLRLAVWPSGLCLDHDVRLVRSIGDPAAFVPLLALVLLAAGAWRISRRAPAVLVGAVFFALAIAPESSILPITDLMFEHRMYLPLAGLAIAVVAGLRLLPGAGRYLRPAVVAVAVVLAAATADRNATWRTEISLWEDTAKKSPRKARPHQSLGLAYGRAGRSADAERELRLAIQCDSAFADPYVNLARLLDTTGREAEVESVYRLAIERSPRHAVAHNNLGLLLEARGDAAAAEAEYRSAIDEHELYAPAQLNLGNLLAKSDRGDEAERAYLRALSLDPHLHAARVNLGVVFAARGETARAEEAWRAVLRADPGNRSARANLDRARSLPSGAGR